MEHPVIDMSNHYFTSWHQYPSTKPLVFYHLDDPNGTMKIKKVIIHCHMSRNIILRPFVRCRMDLTKFKTGDLVDSWGTSPFCGGTSQRWKDKDDDGAKSFDGAGLPAKHGDYMIHCTQSYKYKHWHWYLHNQDMQQAKTILTFTPSHHIGTPLKCKVGYGSEDTAVIETRHRFQAMSSVATVTTDVFQKIDFRCQKDQLKSSKYLIRQII